MAVSGKIERKYMAHFVDSSFGGTTSWYRLGADLEEYNVNLNPDTETGKNILGEPTFKHNGYEMSADADPYYAVVGDALFEKLQDIIDSMDTNPETKAMEVHLWDGDASTGYTAVTQRCFIVPTSYGGDTSGYQIPFSVYYVGERVTGKYVPGSNGASGTFTADT